MKANHNQIYKILYTALISIILLGINTSLLAQFSTDHRNLEEHMRYSRDKKFNTWSVAFGYGPLIMHNDLTSYAVIPDQHWNFGPMLKVSKQTHPAWAIDGQVLTSDFRSGNDAYYSMGNIFDYSINAITYINQWFTYPGPMRDHWNIYMKIGVGVTSYRTRVHFTQTDEVIHYRDIAPENEADGYIVLGYDPEDPYKEIARVNELVTPLTFGVQYRINRSFDLGFETSMRFSLEDKLDNILSGADNDRYWHSNINISYKIGKKNKRHSRWTHRGYGFNVFDKPKKDPLAEEVALLEEQLRQYEAQRTIKIDTVTIKHNAKRIYGSDNMVSIYFDSFESILDTKDQVTLATVALYMTKNHRSTVEIYGYNDSRDDPDENMKISQSRCQEVLSYFVDDLGLDANRFKLLPKGENDLLLPKNKQKSGGIEVINRRSDVVIFDP
ncbi:OmpA family protein [Carboxylicivirga sp. M1479]|uniref:OmpA family protein n=1 Tax=Carboxylicivirga sp. M1479 TaxID=2594476 RepID=UPI0011787566|nr:OmpA family protein [Carboxylicivirga sp. M1479]TRX72161.1 OmpA family protein [Carboxylicivirga sp. M1479]